MDTTVLDVGNQIEPAKTPTADRKKPTRT